jgi:hypothetical protein
MIGTVIKGVTVGVGALAAKLVANAVNNLAFHGSMAGPAKTAVTAGVGAAGYVVLKKVAPKFATPFAIGAGIVVAFDLFDQFARPALPAMLQDYAVGNLQDYQQGSLQGWAPQGGMAGWPNLSGSDSVYGDQLY